MAKTSLKDRLRQKSTELKQKSSGGNIVYLKDGDKLRVRILNMGEEQEFIKEVTQFYLGGDIKGVLSPSTFDEPCALYEKYQELMQGTEEDKKLASKFNARKRYLAYCVIYKDTKGKEIDDRSPRFVLMTSGMYQDIIELFLDEDDWGDMSDPTINGYDLKLGRVGKGKTDTEYSVTACPKTKCPSPYNKKVYDLDEEVRKVIPTYEETEEFLKKFLSNGLDGEEEDEKPKVRSRRRGSSSEGKSSSTRRRRRQKSDDIPF